MPHREIRTLQALIERSREMTAKMDDQEGFRQFKEAFFKGDRTTLNKVGLSMASFANMCNVLGLSPDELVAAVDHQIDLYREAANSRSKPS